MNAFSQRLLVASAARSAAAPPAPGLFETLRGWMRVAAEREALSRLDPRLLADIGVDAGEARREAGRPFWEAPELRRR